MIARPPLRDVVREQMPWLFSKRAFREVATEIGPAFDNALYLLEDDVVRLRFFRDRGPTSLEVAGQQSPELWIPFDLLLANIGVKPRDLAVEGIAPALLETIDDVERALAADVGRTIADSVAGADNMQEGAESLRSAQSKWFSPRRRLFVVGFLWGSAMAAVAVAGLRFL